MVDMCPQANVSTALLGASADPESSRLRDIREDLVREVASDGFNDHELRYFKSM